MTTSLPGIGILGMGFMGQTHLAAFLKAAEAGLCNVVAVADPDPLRRTGRSTPAGNLATAAPSATPAEWRGYAESAQLLEDPQVNAVIVCTPTDTHVAAATAALKSGRHVLVEKPVALDVESIESLDSAARAAGRICMPAMCMRFWPGWTWLKDAVDAAAYGRTLSASFTRIGSRPGWAPEFYLDSNRSGGAIFDLHVHDVDFIHWAFGPPAGVCAVGDDFGVTALYDYARADGPDAKPSRVTATGAWVSVPGFPFRMQFLVEFERAVADFDLTRTPALRLIEGGQVKEVAIPPGAGYEYQACEFLRAIREGNAPAATLGQAARVTANILAQRESQRNGGNRVALC